MKYYVSGCKGNGVIEECTSYGVVYPIRDEDAVTFRGMNFGSVMRVVYEAEKVVLIHKPSSSGYIGRGTTENYPSEYMLFTKEPHGWRKQYTCAPGRYWKRLRLEMIELAIKLNEEAKTW